jgi:hypothetical protein
MTLTTRARASLRTAAVLVLGFSFAGILTTAARADQFALKCNAQKDAVWVYDSVSTLNVQAKLACGTAVDVIDRANGYARIRAAGGVEGFVTENDFASLPSFQQRRDTIVTAAPDVATAAKAAQAREMAQYEASKNTLAGPAPSASAANIVAAKSASSPAAAKSSVPAGVASSQLAEFAPRPAVAAPAAVVTAAKPAAITAAPVSSPAPAPAPDEAPKAAPAPAAAATSNDVADTEAAKIAGVQVGGSCRAYFSAYGLTTTQLKWIEQNRQKEFAGVCPAPDVAHVNFVLIFTHDVDFYNFTMPTHVHNAGGFSDFRPLTTVDTALMSESDANKAHREYVWVFQMGSGTFDPNSFSEHRASQFSKDESNAFGGRGGQKAVEDAFRYVQSAR